ncbi:MAG: hypothetical protein FWG69_03635 [Oscillospiraceae bacterium]|nr:hypothetical protein [Oscillospiraceae bacterium]
MKKSVILGICLGALLFISSIIAFIVLIAYSFVPEIFEDYSNWKTVEIDHCGEFKIPNEWGLHEQDGYFYITDESLNPIIIQTNTYAYYTDIDGYISSEEEINIFSDRVKTIEILSMTLISNGAIYGKTLLLKK